MIDQTKFSPCLHCPRGKNGADCEDKRCPIWQKWFLSRWERIHRYPRLARECSRPEPVGVQLGGNHYAAPHQVHDYLNSNPCHSCSCPRSQCVAPCRVRKAWDHARWEVGQ